MNQIENNKTVMLALLAPIIFASSLWADDVSERAMVEFSGMDKDKNGEVSSLEFASECTARGMCEDKDATKISHQFNEIDHDKNGTLSMQEVMMVEMGNESTMKVKMMDANKDGTVSSEEFINSNIQAMKKGSGPKGSTPKDGTSVSEMLKGQYANMDANKDNSLTAQEITYAMMVQKGSAPKGSTPKGSVPKGSTPKASTSGNGSGKKGSTPK